MSFGLSRARQLDPGPCGLDSHDLPPIDPLQPEAARIDPRGWFSEPGHSLEIEIGCGKGTFLVEHAPNRPDVNYLAIERALGFWRYTADRVRRRGLANVRVLHGDATDFIRFRCPEGIAAAVHLYFSDPWPKTRHHKRRVVQDRTLLDLHRVLAEGGELHLVTDHEGLWTWYEAHAARHADRFERRPFTSPSAADGELVGTNYERKFAREGRPLYAMTLVKIVARMGS